MNQLAEQCTPHFECVAFIEWVENLITLLWLNHQATSAAAPSMSEIVKWGAKNNRLQTQVFDLAQDTVCIRCLDWDRDRFDIEFG